MGLINNTVCLEKNFIQWKKMFEMEKKKLVKIFNKDVFKIEHVGSTSVEGLSAKPIVDIAIGVSKLSDIDKYIDVLDNLYKIKINNESQEILLINENEKETFFLIHILPINSKRYKNMIKFRNILIGNPKILKEYEILKIKLSKQYSKDRKMYTAAKNNYIQKILDEH